MPKVNKMISIPVELSVELDKLDLNASEVCVVALWKKVKGSKVIGTKSVVVLDSNKDLIEEYERLKMEVGEREWRTLYFKFRDSIRAWSLEKKARFFIPKLKELVK